MEHDCQPERDAAEDGGQRQDGNRACCEEDVLYDDLVRELGNAQKHRNRGDSQGVVHDDDVRGKRGRHGRRSDRYSHSRGCQRGGVVQAVTDHHDQGLVGLVPGSPFRVLTELSHDLELAFRCESRIDTVGRNTHLFGDAICAGLVVTSHHDNVAGIPWIGGPGPGVPRSIMELLDGREAGVAQCIFAEEDGNRAHTPRRRAGDDQDGEDSVGTDGPLGGHGSVDALDKRRRQVFGHKLQRSKRGSKRLGVFAGRLQGQKTADAAARDEVEVRDAHVGIVGAPFRRFCDDCR